MCDMHIHSFKKVLEAILNRIFACVQSATRQIPFSLIQKEDIIVRNCSKLPHKNSSCMRESCKMERNYYKIGIGGNIMFHSKVMR